MTTGVRWVSGDGATITDIGKCGMCGEGMPHSIYSADWLFEAEPKYPCDSCGRATCGGPHTWRDVERDEDGEYSPNSTECWECEEGRADLASKNYDYARSRGV